MLILIGDRILLTNLDFQLRNAKITRFWNRVLKMGIAPNKSKYSWAGYFSNMKNGGHRYSTEEFLSKEAKEKLLHLDGGTSLLDFGCGAGELLIYYAPNYEMVVGADFSSSMLDEARKKIMAKNYENVCLIKADEKAVWNEFC